MISKNNHQFYQQKNVEKKQRWGLRKLSVGVASVLLGTTFMLHSNHAVSANTVASDATSTTQAGNTGTGGQTYPLQPSGDGNATTGNGKDQKVTLPQPALQKNVTPTASPDYTPATPTTDKAGVTTGVYNNPLVTSSDWIKMTHGDAIGYYTAKGKDGKTYVTGYAAANGNSQSIFNVDQIDANSLEFHLLYHNGDKEVGSGLWFNFADGKTLQLDTSRLGSEGIQLKSKQGQSYKWSINTGADQGIYYNSWAEYLKAHNNVGDQASQISMTGVALKPDDTIEFVIPVKYTGQLSDRTQSLRFEQDIDDYGSGFKRSSASLYFTTVKKDLSEVKEIDLLPTEFMGEQSGESDWKLVKEISKDMPDGWDAFKITNFPTFKGSFNMDSLPKGDLPSVVYGTAQYYIDLSKIQEIFANHGYTVKYANNNGKAQEMPFYAYSTLPLAKRIDDDRPVLDDPSIWVIHVQAVPAIILNKDQYYVADPNAKPWDPTSMIDEIYAADDAGQRKTRDQLEKLPKTDVDISYEYQAPGAATAAAADKVDLTKAGVYTVTYSHTYADGRVVKDSRKVYVYDVKKDITRTIIVHAPNGTDQKVTQKATLTREVIRDATTGEIKSVGEWSTAKWEAYSAPEFKDYTPDKAQIDETTVNKDTPDTTVEISYTANKTPEQPDHSVDEVKQETKDITRTIIVHAPNGTDQKVTQKATLTREVIRDATTGEIKSVGEWSTAKWEAYSAPEFKDYTPDKAQIDETTVNKDTPDTTVEISYTANKTPEQPDHSVDEVKQETKDITRTIIVHAPNGTDQKVTQKATLTREVIRDATTGEIKSVGEWSTAKWEAYSAPEFKGYTPDKAQVAETTVNENTPDTTVEISYTANETPAQPDHSKDKDKDQGQKPQTPASNENGKHDQATGENTQPSGSTTKTEAPVTANKVAKKLPQTGEKENQLGLLGVALAALGVFGFGWKKREHE
ncbi:mucin-binding protein [Limosilactobacillus oris]|uniref:mucin-binding protein n=1 Tax=Limosilactobacillus oris TaxID=1632 RepID=UPI0024B34532|nr:YSIRK-type signal peptide-containing protein [Limosilactobacillus oris]WHO86092.1 YSIRK-type signal peptide-containing protein [Limosilactobacillus oris]